MGGKEALGSTKASGAVAKLTEKQTQWLSKTLISKNPAQLQFPIALWTREIIRELIKRRFGVTMALTSVGNLMRRLGFSVQRPLMRAYERNPEAVKHWLEVEYPGIRNMTKSMVPSYFSRMSQASDQITIQERRGHRVAKHPWLSEQESA